MSVELRNVTKKFRDVTAVKDFNLKIESQDFTTLLGPSGCGKSTTLRVIAGLETPTEGEVWINGECVYSQEKGIYVSAKERKLGMVFQSYALWPHMTVFENVSFGLDIHDKSNIEKKVKEVTEILEIDHLLERYPNELSGGQQQRVAIARVLVMDYDILLLDEPLSNLDAKLRMDMRAELKRIHREMDLTIIYVTHDQLEALTMSTNIAVMQDALLRDHGAPMQVYDNPDNLFSAKFMGNPQINLLPDCHMDIRGQEVIVKNSNVELSLDAEKLSQNIISKIKENGNEFIFGVRPEDISLKGGNGVTGEVYSVLPAGSEWYFKVDINGSLIDVTEYSGMNWSLGDKVDLDINENKVKFFNPDNEKAF